MALFGSWHGFVVNALDVARFQFYPRASQTAFVSPQTQGRFCDAAKIPTLCLRLRCEFLA